MDKSMHVSRAAYVSAFEHIPYSARGSAITHVVSARVHTTALACARGEYQYVLGIEVKKRTSCFYPHTRILPNMVWSRLYWPLYSSLAVWASCWPCFPCREKHHSCSLLRGIYVHGFLMQSAILPRPSEARADSPAPTSTLHDLLQFLDCGATSAAVSPPQCRTR